jgi:Fe-Mn family superoxide dismutase
MPEETKPLKFKKLKGISERTLGIHHDKLYAGYVDKVNEIEEALGKLKKEGTYKGNNTYSNLRALKSSEPFAVNGMYLHEWYFDVLGGEGDIFDASQLSKAIADKWGSTQEGLKYFSECAMAARGWSVLCWDTKAGKLKHYNSDAHDQGGVWGCIPVITIDVYEHAYFIDYGSNKKAYIEDFWNNLDWKRAEELYKKTSQFKI